PTGKPRMLSRGSDCRCSLVTTSKTCSSRGAASSTMARSRRGWMRRTVPATRVRSRSSTATLRYGATTWQLVTSTCGSTRKPVPVPPPVKIWKTPSCSISFVSLIGGSFLVFILRLFALALALTLAFASAFVLVAAVVLDASVDEVARVRVEEIGRLAPRLARRRAQAGAHLGLDVVGPGLVGEQVVVRAGDRQR